MVRSTWVAALATGMLLALTACSQVPATPAIPAMPAPTTVAATVAATMTATAVATTTPGLASTVPPTVPARPAFMTPTPVMIREDFEERLHQDGFTVERLSEAAQPYLRVFGARLRLSGGSLTQPVEFQSYSYADPALAADDAARVQHDTSVRWTEPDGRGRGMSVAWVAPPHFFHRDGVLVLYVGSDEALLALLTRLLGPQFAGR